MAAAMAVGEAMRQTGGIQQARISRMTTPLPDTATLEDRKARARAWFERLRDDICAAFEAVEDALPADAPFADRAPGRFVRTPWQRTDHGRAGRRRRHVDDARPRVREGRRACLDRARRVRAGIPQGNSRRRRRPALLGLGHLADRASAQSARAGRAHEHALRRHHQGVVRRRRRSHAGARSRAARRTIPTRSPSTPR